MITHQVIFRTLLIASCGDEPVEVKDAPKEKPLWTNGAPGAPWSVNWWLNSGSGS